MNQFKEFRAYMEEELLCEAKDPVSDEDFFQRLYGMQDEEYETLIALDILYSIPTREGREEIADFLKGLL